MTFTSSSRVLLIDDDALFAAMATDALAPLGAHVVVATTLKEARKLLAASTFDVALIDGLLPDGTGVQLIEELRDDGRSMPVIFCSAFWRDRHSHQKLVEELGVREIISKVRFAACALRESVSRWVETDGAVECAGEVAPQ